MQTVLDCFSRHAWRQIYTSKLPVTSMCSTKQYCRSSKLTRRGSILSCRTTGVSSAVVLTIILRACCCNWRRLSTEQPRCAGHRATTLSNGCIAPCWMNTSVSRGGRLGMSRWSRYRQTWTATWNTTTPSGHIRTSGPNDVGADLLQHVQEGSEIDIKESAH